MNDAEYQGEKERVQALFVEWAQRLALSHWDLHFIWHRSRPDDYPEDAILAVSPAWEYLQATFDCYLTETVRLTDSMLTDCVIHELTHCLVSPMRHPKTDERLEEFTVSSLTRVLRILADGSHGVEVDERPARRRGRR